MIVFLQYNYVDLIEQRYRLHREAKAFPGTLYVRVHVFCCNKLMPIQEYGAKWEKL